MPSNHFLLSLSPPHAISQRNQYSITLCHSPNRYPRKGRGITVVSDNLPLKPNKNHSIAGFKSSRNRKRGPRRRIHIDDDLEDGYDGVPETVDSVDDKYWDTGSDVDHPLKYSATERRPLCITRSRSNNEKAQATKTKRDRDIRDRVVRI